MTDEELREEIEALCQEFGVKLFDGELVFPSYLKEEVELSKTFKILGNKTLQ